MKAARIALVVIEVEAFPGEDKAGIMFSLNTLFKKQTTREIEVAAMKIFQADEATPASWVP